MKTATKIITGLAGFILTVAVMVTLAWVSIFGWTWPCGGHHNPLC